MTADDLGPAGVDGEQVQVPVIEDGVGHDLHLVPVVGDLGHDGRDGVGHDELFAVDQDGHVGPFELGEERAECGHGVGLRAVDAAVPQRLAAMDDVGLEPDAGHEAPFARRRTGSGRTAAGGPP